MDDAAAWDAYHKKTHEEETTPSTYAIEREKLFPRGAIIVDMGGGVGNDAIYFLKQGHSVVNLDISDFALNISRERAKKEGVDKNLVTKQVDFGLHQIPIKTNTVDIVFSRISLNYFGKEHTGKLFVDIYNTLKPGGCAYLTFKSPDDTEEMEYLKKTATVYEPNVFIDNGQLRSRFSKDQLVAILAKSGIPNYEVMPYTEKVEGKSQSHKSQIHVNEVIIRKI